MENVSGGEPVLGFSGHLRRSAVVASACGHLALAFSLPMRYNNQQLTVEKEEVRTR